jgi:tetratricopeptide (TPR) repeat protein
LHSPDKAENRKNCDFASAIPLLERYTASNPNDDEALVRLGGAYELTGQRSKAIAAFQRALQANPESDEAKEALQIIHQDREDGTAPK